MSPETDQPSKNALEDQVLEALRTVRDPNLGRDIVDLGLVKDLRICDGNAAFSVQLTTHASPIEEQIKAQAEAAARSVAGITAVKVEMTAEVTASKPIIGEKGTIPGVKNVLAVSSGKGGVGKSTVAVNLACALQQTGARVGILDADVYGPNVPLMLGLNRQGQPEIREKKIVPFQEFDLQIMSMAMLVAEDQPMIWRGPMLHSAVRQFLFDVEWDNLDYLIVDLPPGTGDAQLSLSQQAHVMGSLIVTTPQEVSVLDVRKAIRMFQTVNVPILGVVENMAWFTPPGSTERHLLFGEGGGTRIEGEFGVPMLGQLPIDIAVREGGDSGRPVVHAAPDSEVAVALRDLASRVAQRVSILNAE